MSTTGRTWIAMGAALAGLGVVAGAFGAHGLEGRLTTEQLETFETAVRYQMYHALALVLTGLLAQRGSRAVALAGGLFLAGIALFSGCLYAWVFTCTKTFALIVPLGGVAFILGWFALALAALRRGSPEDDGVR
jgi:uncharacterized membrane protein YgdD (TMEM256/DUF423 family)